MSLTLRRRLSTLSLCRVPPVNELFIPVPPGIVYGIYESVWPVSVLSSVSHHNRTPKEVL